MIPCSSNILLHPSAILRQFFTSSLRSFPWLRAITVSLKLPYLPGCPQPISSRWMFRFNLIINCGQGHGTLLSPSLTRAACVPLVWNFWLDGSRSFRWSATLRCPRVFDDIEIRISLLRTYYRRIWSHIVLSEFKFDSFGLVESSVMEISRTMRNVTSIPRTIVKFDSKRGNKNASVDQLAQGRVDIGLIPSIEFQRIKGCRIVPGPAVPCVSLIRKEIRALSMSSNGLSGWT